jgi:hypothetical protein
MRLRGLCLYDRGTLEASSGLLPVECDTIAVIRHSASNEVKLLIEMKLPSGAALQEPGLCVRKLSDKPARYYSLSIGLCTPRPPRLSTWV